MFQGYSIEIYFDLALENQVLKAHKSLKSKWNLGTKTKPHNFVLQQNEIALFKKNSQVGYLIEHLKLVLDSIPRLALTP